MFEFFTPGFYYAEIFLQLICVAHCLWKRRDTRWLFLVLLLPVVGCIIYVFTEMFSRRQLEQVQSGIGTIIQPTGRIRKLEERLRFSDTFSNRVLLAEACYAAGQTERAIELYEASLTGTFSENEMVLTQLIYAYYDVGRYDDLVRVAARIYKLPQFSRSRAHTLYAIALAETGQAAAAEKEFKTMLARFANFENRYRYGQFLLEQGREPEVKTLYANMMDEGAHLTGHERSNNRQWIGKARAALKSIA